MKKIFLGLIFCSFLISGAAFAREDSADQKNPSDENIVVPKRADTNDVCELFPYAPYCLYP